MEQPSQQQDLRPLINGLSILFPTVFLGWFVISEWSGVVNLVDLIWNAILDIPAFVEDILNYYQALPSDQLLPSLLLGGLFGGSLTAFFYRKRNSLHWRGVGLGTLVGIVGSQLLLYPTQHCTYALETGSTQYWLGLLITVLGALLLLIPIWTVLFGGARSFVSTAGYFHGWGFAYVLLLPSLTILSIFLYYPAIQILTLSLKGKIFPLPQEKFICLDNYTKLADDPIYRNSVVTTGFITVVLVLLTMSTALLIAVLASQKIKGAGIYRTLLIWPFALSPVVSGVIFLAMFREGEAGVINYILENLFGVEGRWLRDTSLAPWVIILTAVWNGLGFNILFYIAGLQNVPTDLLEAAAIDGANVVQRFIRITIPLLSPFTFFLLITNITYAFYGIYGAVDALTQGGPPLGAGGAEGGATNVLIYNLYKEAFGSGGSAGEGAAQALILFLAVALLTLLQFRYVENRVTYSS